MRLLNQLCYQVEVHLKMHHKFSKHLSHVETRTTLIHQRALRILRLFSLSCGGWPSWVIRSRCTIDFIDTRVQVPGIRPCMNHGLTEKIKPLPVSKFNFSNREMCVIMWLRLRLEEVEKKNRTYPFEQVIFKHM